MEMYIYIFLYVIIEAMIIWAWEWRERVCWERNVFRKTKTISWMKRRLLKIKKGRKRRIRKRKKLNRQKMILLSYLRYLQKVKWDETAGQELLVNENGVDGDLVYPKDCRNPCDSANLPTPDTLSMFCGNSVSEETMDKDAVTDDVKEVVDNILSIICETPATEEIMSKDSARDDVKTIIDDKLPILCNSLDKTAAEKITAENDNPIVEDQAKKFHADKTVIVDSNDQAEVIITEPINRPFLYDSDLVATNIVSKPSGPRPLIQWNDFDDVTVDDDVLTGKDGQSWDCEDMFEYNEIHFGNKSSLDKDLSEYTTPLIREDTEADRLRWQRACRLAEEIKTKRLADQATQVSKKKRNKRAKRANVATLSQI